MEISGSGTVLREYVWLGQEPVALREYELRPGLYFYINDHLGTPQQLVDSQGAVVWQAAALPFGKTQVQLGTVQNNLRFPGQYFDAETGLHYNWNRYYDPDTGRYLSPDPIGLNGGLNLYAYVENDPVNWMDPEGLAPSFGSCLAKCAADQLGLSDLAALAGAISGLPILPKSWAPPNATGNTSIWSSKLGNKLGKMPQNPLQKPGVRSWPAPTWKNLGARTNKLGRFLGRWVPGIGWGLLAYDTIKISFCVKDCMDDECSE